MLFIRDYKMLLNDKKVDAFDVCVPTKLHHKIILEALKHDKHVFCEKPLTTRLDYALMIKHASQQTEKKIMVGYLYRFHPTFQMLKQILEKKVLGQIHYAFFRVGGRGNHRPWLRKKSLGGGATLDMLVHMLDLVDWYFGEPKTVKPLVADLVLPERTFDGIKYQGDAEDLVLVKLVCNDVTVICEANLITPSYMNSVEVHGSNGSYFGSILKYLPTIVYCKQGCFGFENGFNFYKYSYVNLFEKELQYFVNMLNGEAPEIDSVESAIRMFKVTKKMKQNASGE